MASKNKRQKLTRPQEARSESTSIRRLRELAEASTSLARVVARNPRASGPLLKKLASHGDATVREHVAEHPSTPSDALELLSEDDSWYVRMVVASNRATPPDVLSRLVEDQDKDVREAAMENPNTPLEALRDQAKTSKDAIREIARRTGVSPDSRPPPRKLSSKERSKAKAVVRSLRRLAKKYAKSPLRLPVEGLPKKDDDVMLGAAFLGLAESVGPCYYPCYESRLISGIDRFGSSLAAPPYVTADWPWPIYCGRPMAPWLQLDLDEIREQTGKKVGNGLLQLWRYGSPHIYVRIRRIPRRRVRRRARLVDIPLQETMAKEWQIEVIEKGDIESQDEYSSRLSWTRREHYIWTLQQWGFIWRSFEFKEFDPAERPWWIGGDASGVAPGYSGDDVGPWQIVGWELAGLSVQDNALLGCVSGESDFLGAIYEHVDYCRDGFYEDIESESFRKRYPGFRLWDEEGRDEKALYMTLKNIGARQRPTCLRAEDPYGPGLADCLFDFPEEWEVLDGDSGRHAVLFAEGWRPLIHLSGPLDGEALNDRCLIYYRPRGRGYEYLPFPIFQRSFGF